MIVFILILVINQGKRREIFPILTDYYGRQMNVEILRSFRTILRSFVKATRTSFSLRKIIYTMYISYNIVTHILIFCQRTPLMICIIKLFIKLFYIIKLTIWNQYFIYTYKIIVIIVMLFILILKIFCL